MFWCVRRRGVRADTRYLPPGGSVGAFAVLALVRAGLRLGSQDAWRSFTLCGGSCIASVASRLLRTVA